MLKKIYRPAYLTILLINLLTALLVPLKQTNFTGQLADYRLMIWAWALISGGLLLLQMAFYAESWNISFGRRLFPGFLFLCLLLTLLCPYAPQSNRFFTAMHLLFALLFFLGVSGYFWILLVRLHFYDFKQARQIAHLYQITCLLCTLLYLEALSITASFELLYTCGLATCVAKMGSALPGKAQHSTK